MAENAPEMKPTVGLTGLTMNAMALIAPGAFLWLTFFSQATTGATAPSMWIGIVVALCFAWRPPSVTRKWRSSIPAPAAPTILPNSHSSTTRRRGPMPGWRSSSSVGAHIFTTGFIRV